MKRTFHEDHLVKNWRNQRMTLDWLWIDQRQRFLLKLIAWWRIGLEQGLWTRPYVFLDGFLAWGHPYGGHRIMKQGVFKVYPVSSPQAPFPNSLYFKQFTLVIGWVRASKFMFSTIFLRLPLSRSIGSCWILTLQSKLINANSVSFRAWVSRKLKSASKDKLPFLLKMQRCKIRSS